jgi:hypothetical protein
MDESGGDDPVTRSRDRHTGTETGSLLVTPDGTVSLFGATAPCAICGSASWTTEVCSTCARYCERLLISGGFQKKP